MLSSEVMASSHLDLLSRGQGKIMERSNLLIWFIEPVLV
jgi:hypothetical protein